MSELPHFPHPGRLLKQSFMDPLELSTAEMARAVNVPRETLRDFIAGRTPVTPELALKLGAVTGIGGSAWMFAQSRYDLGKAINQEGVQEFVIALRKSWSSRNLWISPQVLERLFPSGLPQVFNYFLQGK